jgi:hypothetical protein
MTKYTPEEKEKARSDIFQLLQEGFTPHEAAKKVSEYSPIKIFSLRYMAYDIAVQEGFFSPPGSQHSTDTEHGFLIQSAKEKLQAAGYDVLEEQNEIRTFIEDHGSKGNSDLIGLKGEEIVLVEAVERTKGAATIVNQVERFAKVGKVILIFPVNTNNVELWGLQDIAGS